MAIGVLTDAVFIWNSIDLSDHVTSIDGPFGKQMQLASAMSDVTEKFKAGASTWSVTATLFQDEASNSVMQTLYADEAAGTERTVETRPTSGSRSATNPGYTGTGVIESIGTVSGDWGAMHTTQVVIRAAGDQTRSTTP